MIVRVFLTPSGRLRIVHPSRKRQRKPDQAFRRALEADPTLRDLPFVDVLASDLPERTELCLDCGHAHPCRNLWRLLDGRIARDPALPNPHADHAHAQLELAAELAKPEPDPLEIIRLQQMMVESAAATKGG